MLHEPETLIIGGGIAGLACAQKLARAGRAFLLLTDRLGGRLHCSAAGVPFGATYLTRDYVHVRRHVQLGPRIRRRDVHFLDHGRLRTLFHVRTLGRLRPLARLCSELVKFRNHLNRLRAQAPYRCQAELLLEDEYLAATVHEPASAFVRAHGLEELDEVFTNPIVHSTVFAPTCQVNAFYYLASLQIVILRTYCADFSTTQSSLTSGLGDRIALGRVYRVELDGHGGHRVESDLGTIRPRFLVAATPLHNLRVYCPELADTPAPREVPIHTLHVCGRRREEYAPGGTVFLPPGWGPTILFPWPGADLDILFCTTKTPDLAPYYHDPHIVGRADWRTAVLLPGASWRPLEPRPGVFTVGDHNICGMEDSFLTGPFAANRILASLSHESIAVPAGIDLVARQVGV